MPSTTWSVPDVTCDHCKNAIEGELAGVAGVTSATVDVDARTLVVEGDADADAITGAVDEAGYEALPA
jgi:copper chaperone CopZ